MVRSGHVLAVWSLVAALALSSCGGSDEPGTTPSTSSAAATTASLPPLPKVDLTLGIWGNKAEVAAYSTMVQAYNQTSETGVVTVRSWPDHEAMVTALSQPGAEVPDVFMAARGDLGWLQSARLNRPVDELLDERNVDFGDGYSRDALEGFSADRRLQCMPYGVSPVVVYYNTDLVDFDKMAARDLDVPTLPATKWNLDQFRAALQFAARPRTHAKAISVPPTLEGLAPFIYAAGGSVYNDPTAPTSLSFSSDSTKNALETILPILRDPKLTLSTARLARADAVTWFERGKVAMITGTRALVPQLRKVAGLHFDVLPIPTIDSSATTGDLTGLCLSGRTRHIVEAADFLAYAVSPDSVRLLARTGYLVPANQQVALSADFLQPQQQPVDAAVFTTAVRSMVLSPLLEDLGALADLIAPQLRQLVDAPGVLDLDALTEKIDEKSQTLLSPSESPSASGSASPFD